MYFPVLLEQSVASDESGLWALLLSMDTKREMVLFLWGQIQKLEAANIQDLRGPISGNLNASFLRQMGTSISTALLRSSRKAPDRDHQDGERVEESRGASAGSPRGQSGALCFYTQDSHCGLTCKGSFHKAPGLDGSGSELPGDLPTNTPDTCCSLWEGPLTRTESLMHGPPGRPGGQNDRFHG